MHAATLAVVASHCHSAGLLMPCFVAGRDLLVAIHMPDAG